MTEALPDFALARPATVDEVLAALQGAPGAGLLAGGTDMMVRIRKGLATPGTVIDLSGIGELDGIERSEAGLRIGAGVTLDRIESAAEIARDYPAIARAAATVAGPSHRTVATLGGNLCLDTRCVYYNQSHWWRQSHDFCLKYKGDTCHVAPQGNRCRAAFSGDLAPALMVHDAALEIAGPEGRRRVALSEFYVEDGAAHLALGPQEIVVAVHLPGGGRASDYRKIRVRQAVDFPLAGIAVARDDSGDGVRLMVAVTGTNSRPLLIEPIELPPGAAADDAVFAALDKRVQKAVSPQRTTLIAPHYRRLSAAALAVRMARELL